MELNINGHISVLLNEAVDYLNVKSGKKYIDSTVGGGGHLEAVLQRGGLVLGLDQDPISLERAQKRLTTCPGVDSSIDTFKTFTLLQGNFSHIAELASKSGFEKVDGILFDLGFASFQIDDASRGLSILGDGPLDMRLDPNLAITAKEIVNNFPEKQLELLLKDFGDEPKAYFIARDIVRQRANKPFETTGDLKNLIEKVYGVARFGKTHVATRTFQALRIAVNGEYENLQSALTQSLSLLNPGGRIVVISFHSGEDRIVKNFFRNWESLGLVKVLTKKPIKPTDLEVKQNPRARSALLRAIEKA
jgi:16S rRNA (cytosine1402-N4)-methyltransferase